MSEQIIEKTFKKDGYTWYIETIEREEIVRCRDCKHYEYCQFHRHSENKPNGFCAWAKRKD